MNVCHSHYDRKSPASQVIPQQSTDNSTTYFDKFQVLDKAQDWHVRIPHPWIKVWFRVLHPLSIQLWIVLKMKADWRPGPHHGHTDEWYSRRDLIDLMGTTDRGLRRAISELVFYRLLAFVQPDPTKRSQRGKECRMVLDQDVQPPSETIRLTFNDLSQTKHDVGAPTSCQNGLGTQGQNGLGSQGQNGLGSQGQNGLGSQGQNGLGSLHSNDIGKIKSDVAPSPSSVEDDKGTTTTPDPPSLKTPSPAPPPERPDQSKNTLPDTDLSQLQQIGPYPLDRVAARELVRRSREAVADVTIHEIAHCASTFVPIIAMGKVNMPAAWLCRAVPRKLASVWLDRYRMDQETRRTEVQSTIERVKAEEAAWAAYESGDGPSPLTGRTKDEVDRASTEYAKRRQR